MRTQPDVRRQPIRAIAGGLRQVAALGAKQAGYVLDSIGSAVFMWGSDLSVAPKGNFPANLEPTMVLTDLAGSGAAAQDDQGKWVKLPEPSGPAGGDLSGRYPNPTVARINTTPLGTLTGASSGQVLKWNGSAWVPGTGGGASVSAQSINAPFGDLVLPANTPFEVGALTVGVSGIAVVMLGGFIDTHGAGGAGAYYALDVSASTNPGFAGSPVFLWSGANAPAQISMAANCVVSGLTPNTNCQFFLNISPSTTTTTWNFSLTDVALVTY